MTLNNIKQIRESKGMTQKELAEAVGIKQVNISQYENGTKKPKLERLKKITNVLNVSYLDLIDDDENEQHVIKYVKSKWNIDLEPLK